MPRQYPDDIALYLDSEPQATLARLEKLLGSHHPFPEAYAFQELGLEYASRDQRDAERAAAYVGYAFELVATAREHQSPKLMYQLARSLANVYLNLEPRRPLQAVAVLERALEIGAKWWSEDLYPEDEKSYDRCYPERGWILKSLHYWKEQLKLE